MKSRLSKIKFSERKTKKANGMELLENWLRGLAILLKRFLHSIFFLLVQRADLGLAGLTITYQREQVFNLRVFSPESFV